MYVNIKKLRFLFFSVALIFLPYYIELTGQGSIFTLRNLSIYVSACIISSLMAQFLENSKKSLENIFFVSFATLIIICGLLGTLYFFPNLALYVKFISWVFFVVILYSLFLVNNVVIVVEYRGNVIPLYRAAVSWIQVILLSTCIPLFATIFKLPVLPVFQALLIFFVAYTSVRYLIWVYRFDEEARRLSNAEKMVLSFSSSYLVLIAACSVMFLPAEAFMRAVFVVSILLGVLNYTQLFLKNALTRRFVDSFYIRSIIFFFLVFLFS